MRSALFVALLVATASVAAAQPQALVDLFERRTIESDGLTMRYGLYVPEGYDPAREYPLVLALHGSGERGDDLVNLERSRLATAWVEPARQAAHPAFVVAPQAPSGLTWTEERDPIDPDQSGVSATEEAVLAILDGLAAEFSIDPDRLYVVGLSMGGHGVWDLVSRFPDRFAAAVPMSGEGFASQADDLADVPIWAFTGEQDTVVPSLETRRVVQAMEDLGRDVVYTHCRRSPVAARAYDCPGFIGRDSLAAAVDAHADLLYWSEPATGHGPWAPWFDNPLLAPWLFSWVRQDPDAVTVTAPTASARWDGTESVTWTTTRTTPDTVEVWLNRTDDAADWRKLGEAPLAAGAFAVDTDAFADAARARVRLIVRDADGRVAGRDESARFVLDHAGDAPPELTIQAEDLRFDPRLGGDAYRLSFLAADADGDALTAELAYSVDGGQTYVAAATPTVDAAQAEQTVTVDLRPLPNAREARFRLTLSDGTTTVAAETVPFLKQTPRDAGAPVTQTAGDGTGTVSVRVVDEAALTGHRYRVAVSEADDTATYAVTDLDTGAVVLDGVPLSDGVQESPIFDGLALVVEDLDEGRADPEATGWVAGDTDLGVTVSGGSVRIAILTVDLLATETDYEITVTDDVVGQSVAIYNIAATDVRFAVTGADGAPRDVAFVDDDGDGQLGDGDVLYLVEPDADGQPALAWKLAFAGGTEPPEAGDVFRLVPVRSLGAGDVFEFDGRLDTASEPGPEAASLAVYPNPFADRLTVAYRLAAPAAVRVEVFDALGRRVARLADGPAAVVGRLVWDARGVASGVYVVRLTTAPDGRAPATVRQSVVRVGR